MMGDFMLAAGSRIPYARSILPCLPALEGWSTTRNFIVRTTGASMTLRWTPEPSNNTTRH